MIILGEYQMYSRLYCMYSLRIGTVLIVTQVGMPEFCANFAQNWTELAIVRRVNKVVQKL